MEGGSETPQEVTSVQDKQPKRSLKDLDAAYIRKHLDTAAETQKLLDTYGFEVFQYQGSMKSPDDTDAFIQLLEIDGTKEAACKVVKFLSLDKVKVNEDLRLSLEHPLPLHLCQREPLRSWKAALKADDVVREAPASLAKLDCDDVCHLLRMFDGFVAPAILDCVFIPLLLHDGVSHESRWRELSDLKEHLKHLAGKSKRSGSERSGSSDQLRNTADTKSSETSFGASRNNSLVPLAKLEVCGVDLVVWRNPIYSARLFEGETRTYAGPALKELRVSSEAENGCNHWDGDSKGNRCRLFTKPGLKTLAPQSYYDRILGGGGMLQVLWPFHERRAIHVSYGILNIHNDVGCFKSLVFNHNIEVFAHRGCQAIIIHVLSEVSSLIYADLVSNVLTVLLWLIYSKQIRDPANTRSHISARFLMCSYMYRSGQLVVQVVGASFMSMHWDLISSAVFWWKIFQTFSSVVCLWTVWDYGNDLSNRSRAIVSAIIALQWWNALYSVRVVRTLGESIMPIIQAILRLNVVSFIILATFFTCGMAHALYTVGLHGLYDSVMLSYRLGILGDFDLGELDGTGTGFKATDKTNTSLVSLDMEMYDFESSFADHNFARFFLMVISLVSTVLLINVLIGVLSRNFEETYHQRSPIYWRAAGRIALQSAQQWEGLCHITKAMFRQDCLRPILYKVTAVGHSAKNLTPHSASLDHQHLYFSTAVKLGENNEVNDLNKRLVGHGHKNTRERQLDKNRRQLREQLKKLRQMNP